jgi:hypothetical protein
MGRNRYLHYLVRATVACSLAAAVAGVLVLSGCGGDSGPQRYNVSGSVTFDGKPVPAGSVLFEPDRSKGNSGPAAAVKIKDGKYDSKIDGKGTVGGPHVVKITGMDGVPQEDFPDGTVLFAEYSTTVDLPKGDGVQDFDVPATAGAPKPTE